MGLVIFSDLHLHEWTYGASTNEKGINTRLENQRQVVFELLDYCDENHIDDILFCGDLFHTQNNISTQVLSVAWNTFSEFKKRNKKLHVLVGNHDMSNRAGSIHSLKWIEAIGHLIESEETFEVQGMRVAALPFTENKEILYSFLNKNSNADLMMLHQGVSGVPLASGYVMNDLLTRESIPEDITHAFTGHYHVHKKVSKNLTVVGSTTQQTWADCEQPRGWIHYIPDVNIVKHIQSKLAFKFKKLTSMDFEPFEVKNCFVRFDIEVPQDMMVELREKCMDSGALSVEFKIDKKEEITENITDVITLEDLLNDFEKDLPDDLRKVGKKIREGTYEVA